MQPANVSKCWKCARFTKRAPRPTCEAFQNGIPAVIYFDGKDHSDPYPGDGGKLFKLTDDGKYADAVYDI